MAKKESSSDGLKFLSVSIENFKNIKSKVIDIGGRSFIVTGHNGAGKSSLIQALLSPLDTKIIPSQPIKKGEDRSTVEVVIGGTIAGQLRKYTMDLYFTKGNQKGRLVVTDETGAAVKSPATLLKSIIGSISFDIFQFLNDSKDKKIATLKQLSGKGVQIDMASSVIKEKKEARKRLNDKVVDLTGAMNNHGFSDDDIDKYSTPIPIDPINAELSEVSKSIDDYTKVENGISQRSNEIKNYETSITNARTSILSKESQIEQLKKDITAEMTMMEQQAIKISTISKEIDKGNEWINSHPKPSAAEISNRMSEASAHNVKCSQIEQYAQKQRDLIKTKEDVQKINIDIDSEEKKREDIIAGSQLPVKGLTFNDEEIFIDGLPLEEEQINTAKLIDIGQEIAIALNPNLKVIFLKDGSLLDHNTLKSIIEKGEKRGYQYIVECLSDDGELEVKFTETELNQEEP